MQIAHARSIDFEHRILRTTSIPEVSAVAEPSVQNQLVPKVVIAHANDELIFHPDQSALEGETRRLERGDELHQQRSSRHARVHAGTGVRRCVKPAERGALHRRDHALLLGDPAVLGWRADVGPAGQRSPGVRQAVDSASAMVDARPPLITCCT